MTKSRLWQNLLPTYLIVVLVCALGVGGYTLRSAKSLYIAQISKDLESMARLIELQIEGKDWSDSQKELEALCNRLSRTTGVRITLIQPSGVVITDTWIGERGNHLDRPEIQQALAGQVGQTVRYSQTAQEELLYVAIPIQKEEQIAGVIRTSVPMQPIHASVASLYGQVFLVALLATAVAGLMSLKISQRINRSLETIRQGAKLFAQGEFGRKISPPVSEEFSELVESLNVMASVLDEKIRAITLHKNEQDAVLSSMTEGVLAVDMDERVLSLNQTAARLLGVHQTDARGRNLQEVIRSVELERFVARVITSGESVEGEVVLRHGEERFLQVHGTLLRGTTGKEIGALLVINDITRLRRLETMRRDFVANVSHELKTPVTSIKGFVETLREGALDDPEKAREFLEIISKQAERLEAIIEDLLTLSRIEQDAKKDQVERVEVNLAGVLEAAISDCEAKASERGVRVLLDCSQKTQARINPRLIEQAIVNLLDNAIKFSEPKSTVKVSADVNADGLILSVRDWGCGIPEEHLPRLFERFYRVDKSRSRKQGGTGLGLSIVKHIVQAHGGSVTVESIPGEGSVFSIRIPQNQTTAGKT